ncbi:hypothetical protein HZS_912 [Henneguya salminicola]|nr:hypothetical protein HZS_912 [Henneguya salminicola]
MMLAVLLFSYIIFINLPSSITINGYEEAIKRQINAEDTNPSIIEGKLSNSTNHLASQIKYDFKLKAIYILTYQKSEVGMIKDSKLYYSLLTDLYFTLIELKKPNLDFQFTRIEAGPEIIVGVSEMKNLIAISTNLGKDWIVNFLKFDGVDQIVISQQNRDHIAIVSKKGEIYLIIEFGARRSLQAYYGAQPIWPSISESLYLLEKSRFDTNIYVTKTDYISLRPSIVLKQAIDFGQSGNIIWVVTKDENKAHIHFIEKNDEVNKAHFPKFLKPKNFYPFNSNSQIFTIVINETNGVFFYTASTTDLRFIRIGDNIRPSFNYSYDLGHTWKYSTLEGNSLIPIKTFHDSSSSSILTTIITFNDSTKEWGFIKIDFTHTLKKDCDIIDYEIYTPGLHDKSTCFQGQKQFTLRRKHDVKCKTLLDKLPKIQPDICQCTQDDFSCTFGHYFINGQCLKDLDESEILDICVPGEISIMPSKKKKLEDDICKSNENWSAKETDICKFTAQDNLLSVLIGSTIKYIYFDGNEKQEFTNLPIDLTHVGNIYSYSINFNRRCLYVLNETGIIQFCYNKNELSFINSEEMFLKDYSILVPNKYCVDFLSMNGEMKFSICYDAPINAVSLDAQNEHYVIFFKGFVSRVDYNYEFVEKKVEASKDILAAYVNACEIDELLCDNDSMCVFYTNICDGVKNCEDGKDELNCHKVSKCNQRQYRCLNGDCILKTKYCDSNKDCSDNSDEESCLPSDKLAGCKYFEARCNNGDCVMKNQLCDNNFDCADLSDEHGCDLIVDATINISCLIKCDNKCIPHDNVCNHISDCSDGKDELNCKNKALCSSEGMLNCNSYHLCYELFRNCDGFKDCSDGVDEANCESINYQVIFRN